MKTTRKAARIGGAQLLAGIEAASANAKTRIAKLDQADVDGVAGGVDVGGAGGGIDIGDLTGTGDPGGTTAGMYDPVELDIGKWND